MTEQNLTNRRLAAILAADVVGYSVLVENDEAGTLARLKSRRQRILDPLLKRFAGRIVKVMGDGVLVEFGSAVNAVRFGLEMQREMDEANSNERDASPIVLRVGINVGDVVVDGSDLYGDGVIIAARLESIAQPGTVFVSNKVHEELRGKINLDFFDFGDIVLKNIERPVRVFRVGPGTTTQKPELAMPIKAASVPSLAILPFKSLSNDPNDQHTADGITEDVLTEISRFRYLRVAARYTSIDDTAKAGFQRLAAEIGTEYYAHGTLRRIGDQFRITIQLIQSSTGNRIWSQKFDVAVADIDGVVAAIVASLEENVVTIAAGLARMRPRSDWTAVDYVIQGRELCNASREPDAVPLLRRAVEVDPQYASARAWLSLALTVTFHTTALEGTIQESADHANVALTLDSNDPAVHHANGMVHTWLRNFSRAGNHFDRALALNPADRQIKADRSNWQRYCGNLPEALSEIDAALDRYVSSPTWFWAIRGEILFDMKRYAEALASFRSGSEKTHRFFYVAAAHAYLGDMREAQNVRAAMLKSDYRFNEEELRRIKPHAVEATFQHLVEGLKLAGLL